MGYSWDIRMYRVCVGYVSGMYRESVEGDGARGGRYANHGRARMDTEKKNIDILARKLAEIIVRPKGDKKSKLSKLKTKRVIG